MSETKNKIIKTSEALFFEYGIANVRLQQIADEVGISVGNLAYHFKNKEAIVVAVYDSLLEELSNILTTYLEYPNLEDFDKQFSDLYAFLMANPFYVNNIWEIERTYPEIKEEWSQLNAKILLQIKKRIEFNVSRGIIKKEQYLSEHDLFAQNIFLTINFWIPQQMLRNKKLIQNQFKRALWSIIFPYLTPKGKEEFTALIAPKISM
jgi:AcrR family transcriptional regulator